MVGVLTSVGVMTVGVMTVGVMRRPRYLNPPPPQFTKVSTNKDDCRSASYVPLFLGFYFAHVQNEP